MAPLVSVIMPVYNREAYVEEAARSVLDQTLGDLELIAVDDGSADRSVAVLDALATLDPRLRVIRAPHGGQSAALNRGLAAARGQRIAFQDSDDLWRPRLLERLEAALGGAGADGAAFAYGRFRYFADENDPEDRARWLPDRIRRGRSGRILRPLCRANFIARIVALIPRAALERAGPRFDPEVGHATDWDLFLRLARVGEARRVDAVLALVRVHGTNLSHDVLAHTTSFVKVLEAETARCGSRAEAADLGLPRAIAFYRTALARRLLLGGLLGAAREEALRALPDAGPLEKAFAAALAGATAIPGGARLFRGLQEAALALRRGVGWGARS